MSNVSANLEQELNYDENGWLCYPDGIKLKNIDFETYKSLDYINIIETLGYLRHELYVDFYRDLSPKRIFNPERSQIIAFSELFTDKVVFLLRCDGKKMNLQEIEELKTKMKSNRTPEWGLSRDDLLLNLGYAIQEQAMSQQFVEKVFNRSCVDNVLDADKFHFEFTNNILSACCYDGYDVTIFVSEVDITFDEIKDYLTYANTTYQFEDTMKTIINNQIYCANKIDRDILWSDVSRKKFAYDEDAFCINYIAMAAHYKQCDVEQDLFIKSTDGQYEIISKESHNGITTTKIRAYHELFTFTNGHSMPVNAYGSSENQSSIISSVYGEDGGYVYVMINSSLNGLVKIGKTTKNPDERAKELSSATGVPTPFVVVFYKEFKNCSLAEQQIHKFLEDNGCRINDNREFFNIPINEAIEVVQLFYDKEQLDPPIAQSQEELSDAETKCLYGIWKSKRMKFDDTWYDVSRNRFAEFGRTVVFNEDGSFEDKVAGIGDHSGSYEIHGRNIHTYLVNGKYIIYHINSIKTNFADMTLIILDHLIQIEFEKEQ